jgi:hypothetical protein
MGIFVCNICKNEFNRINSLRSHSSQKHNLNGEKDINERPEWVISDLKHKLSL